ncbi:MAG: hypothetical protein J7647_18265 [Cyanobacteria bacterium SBLK]|nr:hypothetical protein [Cyanobacteria bacterium SBLK]
MTESQGSQSDRYNKIINNLKKINEENSQVLKQAKPEERATLSPLLDRLKLQEEVATLYILLPKIRKLLIKIENEEESSDRPSQRARKNKIRQDELEILLQHTEKAIDLLTHGHPSIYLAQEIRINIQKMLNFYDRGWFFSFFLNRWSDFCNSKSDPLKVVMGLLISTPIFLALFAIALYYLSVGQNQLKVQIEATRQTLLIGQYRDDPEVASQESSIVGPKVKNQIQSEIQKTLNNSPLDLEGLSPNEKKLLQEEIDKRKLSQLEESQQDYDLLFFLLLVACSGAFGSIISLFIRMNDFEEKEYSNPLILLLTGALKPLIGAIFGLLLCGVLKSGILTVRIDAAPEQHKSDELLFCSLAFVVGFSERLAKDVIKRTENTLLGSSEQLPALREETHQEENQER